MSVSNTYDVVNKLFQQDTKSVGQIESVSVHSSAVFVVVRRLDSGGHKAELFNNIYNSLESDLSLYELAIPLVGIDLNNTSTSHLALIGKYVMVTEKDGVALVANYLGDIQAQNEEITSIPREAFIMARANLFNKEQEMTKENVQEELMKLGVTRENASLVFGVDVEAALNNVILWAGDSYFHKDTGKAEMKEVIVEPPNFVKYLNKHPIKMKACHKFNKLFTGR